MRSDGRWSEPGSRMLSQCPHQFLRCRFAVAQCWVIAGPVAGEVNGAINREGRMSLKATSLGFRADRSVADLLPSRVKAKHISQPSAIG
jgi:hypothetical protein